MAHFYRVIETEFGFAGFVASERGLERVYLPARSRMELVARIERDLGSCQEAPGLLPKLAADLVRYFAGQPVAFDVSFDWGRAGEFEQAVWRACFELGYGQRTTYAELARRVGRPAAARAVGAAMGRNPCPIVVPCHRVLRSDGGLGGYSGPGGVAFKQQLLDMEQAAHAAV